ncbi:MAG: NAD(P)H-dependent oxidoreductase [Pseudomonadota bacterium]
MARPRVLVFGASNSRRSINRQFAVHAADVLNQQTEGGVEIEVLDLNDFEMPIYSPERQEATGIPAEAQAFFARIAGADAVIVSFAEYNGSYTAAYKNIFDWASRIDMKVYQGKPMLALATSVGKGGAMHVLRGAVEGLPFFGGIVVASFNFGPFGAHFDADTQRLTTPDLAAGLGDAVAALGAALAAESA